MRYIFLRYGDEREVHRRPALGSGRLVAAAPLRPVRTATTLRRREGVWALADGPAAEGGEPLSGCWVVDCGDLDEAVEWAKRLLGEGGGAVEIRPLAPTVSSA